MTHYACGWEGARRGSLWSPVRDGGLRRRKGAVRAPPSNGKALPGRESSGVGQFCRPGRRLSCMFDVQLRKTPDPLCVALIADDLPQRMPCMMTATTLPTFIPIRRRAES